MKFEKKKHEHGWRWIIEDPDTKERWNGNIEFTIAKAKVAAIEGFIEDKKASIPKMQATIRQQKKSIQSLTKLLENETD